MELTERALLQVLLSRGDIRAGRNIGHDLLTTPATVEDLGLGVREAPFQVHDQTGISRLFTQVVRVLEIELVVGPTLISC
jgi:hypothetical protein